MTPLVRLVATATLAIALLISATHLLGAEDGPGDGFTAGIIASLGLTLEYLAFGYAEAHRRLRRVHFIRVLAFGLAISAIAALLPMAGGGHFLGAAAYGTDLPMLGEVHLSLSMLFDLGICGVVVGGSMAAVDSLRGASQ